MIKDFQKYGGAYRGSGWAWLAYDITKDLVVFTITENEDSLLDDEFEKMEPLLCIDLWEHAYYQKYESNKKEYLQRIWELVDWWKVE